MPAEEFPVDVVLGALLSVSQRAAQPPSAWPEVASTFALAIEAGACAVPLDPARNDPSRPELVPAAGGLPWIDETREGLSVFQCVTAGRTGTRRIGQGGLVLASQRPAVVGDQVVVAQGGRLLLVALGAATADAKWLGTVEAVIQREGARSHGVHGQALLAPRVASRASRDEVHEPPATIRTLRSVRGPTRTAA